MWNDGDNSVTNIHAYYILDRDKSPDFWHSVSALMLNMGFQLWLLKSGFLAKCESIWVWFKQLKEYTMGFTY